MAPVTSHGIESHVAGDTAQLVATVLTSAIAVAAVLATIALCRRRNITWPLLVLVSGGATFLLEPMFDHYYGLWFFTENQWTAVTTYGIHVPVWLPIVYVPYYGTWTVWLVRRFSRGATQAEVMKLFVGSVALAALAETLYIQVFNLYEYQDHQPFTIAGYPVFVAFVNGVPPFLAAIVLTRLLPVLRGSERLAIVGVVPVCFATGSFGPAWLYLAARHSGTDPSMVLIQVLALVTVAGVFALVLLAARLAGIDRSDPSADGAREVDPAAASMREAVPA
jgi:hypothetical protein